MSNSYRIRNIIISIFAIAWTAIFHYESTRSYFLEPIFQTRLPKTRFLFPPAGWIMFYNVDETCGFTEVYGVKDQHPELIDPHQIFETKAVGYDNIHRNVLSTVLVAPYRKYFCNFLKRKFPKFDEFLVTAVEYPSVIQTPEQKLYKVMYICR